MDLVQLRIILMIKEVSFLVKKKMIRCVSKGKMSPVTARLKCPYKKGEDIDESKAATEVSGSWKGEDVLFYFIIQPLLSF